MRAEAGKLRHRIDVYGKVKYTNEQGRTAYKDGKILERVPAEIIPQTGKLQSQQANTILANVTHKVIVRYHAGKNITNDMHIMYRGHRFDIRFILNPYFTDESLEIYVEEIVE